MKIVHTTKYNVGPARSIEHVILRNIHGGEFAAPGRVQARVSRAVAKTARGRVIASKAG